MTKQIVYFLLPSIADQSARFCFSQLLETLLKLLTKADESGGTNSKIAPTPWLLYGVLAFVKTHLGLFTWLFTVFIDKTCIVYSFKVWFIQPFVVLSPGSTSALSLVKCYIQVLEILIVQLPHPGKQLSLQHQLTKTVRIHSIFPFNFNLIIPLGFGKTILLICSNKKFW